MPYIQRGWFESQPYKYEIIGASNLKESHEEGVIGAYEEDEDSILPHESLLEEHAHDMVSEGECQEDEKLELSLHGAYSNHNNCIEYVTNKVDVILQKKNDNTHDELIDNNLPHEVCLEIQHVPFEMHAMMHIEVQLMKIIRL